MINRLPTTWDEACGLESDLQEAIGAMAYGSDIRVILLEGGPAEAFKMTDALVEAFWTNTNKMDWLQPSITAALAQTSLPIIGAFNGPVTGVGLELALCCDVRIASEAATFSMPHINFGLIPWEGGSQRLVWIVGQAKALELILLGESISAHEAQRIGMIHRIVTTDMLKKSAWDLAADMAQKSRCQWHIPKRRLSAAWIFLWCKDYEWRPIYIS